MAVTSIQPCLEYYYNISPCVVLINTTDSLSSVMATGYLNGTWPLGNGSNMVLSNAQICAVQTTNGLAWLQVSIVGGNSSLVPPLSSPKTQSTASRTLNSGFQISSSQSAMVTYSVDVACTLSLTTGQSGTVYLDMAQDSGFTTGLQTISQFTNANTGTLTIGLNLTQTMTGVLSGFVPAGYYCRLRTVNNTSTPTFTYKIGQETLM